MPTRTMSDKRDCSIQKVDMKDVPRCVVDSFWNTGKDCLQGESLQASLYKEDRFLYIAVTLLIVFMLIMFRVQSSEPNCFFASDPLWCPM